MPDQTVNIKIRVATRKALKVLAAQRGVTLDTLLQQLLKQS